MPDEHFVSAWHLLNVADGGFKEPDAIVILINARGNFCNTLNWFRFSKYWSIIKAARALYFWSISVKASTKGSISDILGENPNCFPHKLVETVKIPGHCESPTLFKSILHNLLWTYLLDLSRLIAGTDSNIGQK